MGGFNKQALREKREGVLGRELSFLRKLCLKGKQKTYSFENKSDKVENNILQKYIIFRSIDFYLFSVYLNVKRLPGWQTFAVRLVNGLPQVTHTHTSSHTLIHTLAHTNTHIPTGNSSRTWLSAPDAERRELSANKQAPAMPPLPCPHPSEPLPPPAAMAYTPAPLPTPMASQRPIKYTRFQQRCSSRGGHKY